MAPLQSQLLAALPWLRHGFGTRATDGWLPEYTNVKQIHSDKVVTADGRSGCLEPGDALITSEPGKWIGVRTADCVPILIADPLHRAVAAVHAGWRGTVASIAGHTVERLTREFGSDPAELRVAIGPAIGRCCFEVGPEVAQQFNTTDTYIDLLEANYRILAAAGVTPGHIDVMRLCTVCCGDKDFHSFRRDKDQSGRMVSAICIGFKR
jgi:YfiH family protein